MAWMKRLAAPKIYPIERKTKKFVVSPRGPHRKEYSIPLLVVVRDVLKLAQVAKEAKNAIKQGQILVDGRKIKDHRFGVGYLDVISIPSVKKTWRIVPPFKLIETTDSDIKICKVIDKKILKRNRTQLNLDGGRNIITGKSYPTRGSVIISIPKQEVKDYLEMKKGNTVLVLEGRRAGTVAKIEGMEDSMLSVDANGEKFEVPERLVAVVGRGEPVVRLN